MTNQLHIIIHSASAFAAAAATAGARTPGLDIPAIQTIAVTMLLGIARELGVSRDRVDVVASLQPWLATLIGRATVSRVLAFFPGPGDLVNAAVAGALTESIGWAAVNAWQPRQVAAG